MVSLVRLRNLASSVHAADTAQLSQILGEGTRAEFSDYHSAMSAIDEAIAVALSTATANSTARLKRLQSDFDTLRTRAGETVGRLPASMAAPLVKAVQSLEQFGNGKQSVFEERARLFTSTSAARGALLEGQLLSSQFVASAQEVFSEVRRSTSVQSEFFSDQISRYTHVFVIMAGLCLLGAGVVLAYVNRSIVVRLRALSESMRARSEGRNVPIPIKGSDELTDMARATQFFTAAIERREQEARDSERLLAILDTSPIGVAYTLSGQMLFRSTIRRAVGYAHRSQCRKLCRPSATKRIPGFARSSWRIPRSRGGVCEARWHAVVDLGVNGANKVRKSGLLRILGLRHHCAQDSRGIDAAGTRRGRECAGGPSRRPAGA